MCKICGCLVANDEQHEVAMGGRLRTVCDGCKGKTIPMLNPVPGCY